MLQLQRTTSDNYDFIQLVKELDKELAVRDGEDMHPFYAQFNKIDKIKHVVMMYQDDKPIACGSIKIYDELTMEVKRMYTTHEARGKGVASTVLTELEKWAKELSYQRCILETGVRQPEAIRLYEKNDYIRIDNYGQYTGIEDSVCFEKILE